MSRRIELMVVLFAGLAVGLAGCPKGGGGEADTGVDTGQQVERDTGPEPEPVKWRVSTVEGGGVGLHVDLVAPEEGPVSLAYFTTSGESEGPCDEVADMSPPQKVRWGMHFARKMSDGWQTETVARPLFVPQPPGLDLEVAPDGTPTLAAMTGQPLEMFGYCGVNDAGLYTRQGADDWEAETVVASSGEASSEKPGSNFGEVVGYWSSLAYGPSGQRALSYKDVHAGGIQSDDQRRADLEMALDTGGGWQPVPVDDGRGAGDKTQVAFDPEGRPVVVYVVPTESQQADQVGVWIARSEDGGSNWTTARLFNQPTGSRPALAIDPEDGSIHVLFYNARRGFPQLASLENPAELADVAGAWELTDIGDGEFDEGYDPALGWTSDGRLAAAYYRCGLASSGLGDCNGREDGLVYAERDASFWSRKVVDEGGSEGFCGRTPALGLDSDDHPVLGYRCERKVDGRLEATVRFAIRR